MSGVENQREQVLPSSGDLRTTRMPELLWRLHRARVTGRLTVTREGVTKSVWLAYGQPVFARSTDSDDRLTERLRQRGLLTRDEFETAQVAIEAEQGARRIGEILLDTRLIRKQVLDESLHEQLVWILDSMFHWDAGAWTFHDDETSDEPVTLNLPMAAIIMEGARNRLPLPWMWETIGGAMRHPRLKMRGDRPRVLEILVHELRLVPSEQAWLGRMEGAESIASMLDDFEADERELVALLYTLALTERIELLEAGPTPSVSIS
ncbi:MAG: DUF4388 domain-containing protein, partial [Nannocystaceae bacterium]